MKMRTTTLATLIALLALTAIPAEAQRAVMVGTNRAEVRVNVGFEMPEFLVLRQTSAPVATTRGAGYTEYQMTFTVAANTQWTLTAATLPQGITLLTEAGTFQNELGAIVTRGQATNSAEQKVTLRVANGTPATWQQNLQFELRDR
jgi:hypothetical protein